MHDVSGPKRPESLMIEPIHAHSFSFRDATAEAGKEVTEHGIVVGVPKAMATTNPLQVGSCKRPPDDLSKVKSQASATSSGGTVGLLGLSPNC